MTLPDFSHEGQALSSNRADDQSPEKLAGHPEPAHQDNPADATLQASPLAQQVITGVRLCSSSHSSTYSDMQSNQAHPVPYSLFPILLKPTRCT